jgi:ferredoxin-NADP reductase
MAPISLTDEVFICGPQKMTNAVISLIENKFNFDSSYIHFELFTANMIERKTIEKPKKKQ